MLLLTGELSRDAKGFDSVRYLGNVKTGYESSCLA